ncbi:coiled-coil domain-containing protein 34 [Drosophila albomicans]|uniref:Coiled-coil domain-containing protein 34 n=1 Tax=Drosophila albomicans TaxID=7291 RepID=A0A6P8WQB9_DROAB|nr:coiled-coil domain-containing protein 34 [Drosophila albomicans]XP_051858512.1 coiled-coil domain-containing protein 34 [Drosophila albomicans]XP_051858513.1 coiled-coil domain-containing protein 34 [Drosophila albomicans]
MAFVGRMSCRGKFADCELYKGGRSKIMNMPSIGEDEPEQSQSRTYIKSYGMERHELISIPSTIRFVAGSASSCEINSMADTEMSTLRYTSPRSLELETETLCQSRVENSSENSSMSESNEYTDPTSNVQPRMSIDEEELQKRQLERGSTTSMCSWEPEEPMSVYEETPDAEQDSHSCGIPFLELGSETISIYGDQQEQLAPLKVLRHSNEAYDNWLSGKKRQCQYRQQAARQQRQQQLEKDMKRRQLSEQRVQEWCKRKAQQVQQIAAAKRSAHNYKSESKLEEHTRLRRQAWELRKIREEEERRQLQQRMAYEKELHQQERKKQANLAWQHWMKSAAQRPKPVPLNQGFNTLRGTVSDIYINPNQWVHFNANPRT